MTTRDNESMSAGFDDAENQSANTSGNRPFSSVLEATLSRRKMLAGSLAAAGATFLSPFSAHALCRTDKSNDNPLVGFTPLSISEVKAADGKTVTVSSDYEYQVLIPWGTPIDPESDVPEYKGGATRPTAAQAERQIGIGHDGMWFFPMNQPEVRLAGKNGLRLPEDSRSGLLCINHEFGKNMHVLGKDMPESLEDVRLSQAVHGVSVVAIGADRRGNWTVRSSQHNRRVTVNSPVTFSGPVAGTRYIENASTSLPQGTVNNCGSGPTPWGTYLTCEENFNAYFGAKDAAFAETDPLRAEGLARYSFKAGGTFGNYQWWVWDPRFDYSDPDYRNEINRFGWCVEIDPFDCSQVPVKRTAMGRVKHEAVAFLPERFDSRAICYMGDDQRGDYCYKYVSDKPWRDHIEARESPLDHGKLYVARFDEGPGSSDGMGTGEWIELTIERTDLAARFKDQAQLLVYTRLAADIVGATPMDRPEWTTVGRDGEVYWTVTNNTKKDGDPPQGVVGAANPIYENSDGHIIKTVDVSDTEFEWTIFILARNTRPSDPGADPKDLPFAAYRAPSDGGENTFSDPDTAWADPYGRLFIGTDGGQPSDLQNQLVVFDVASGEYKRLLTGVNGDEITGITTTPDYRTMFTNTQHPGNGDPKLTNFPASTDEKTVPRDCTIVLTRKDMGIVGS